MFVGLPICGGWPPACPDRWPLAPPQAAPGPFRATPSLDQPPPGAATPLTLINLEEIPEGQPLVEIPLLWFVLPEVGPPSPGSFPGRSVRDGIFACGRFS